MSPVLSGCLVVLQCGRVMCGWVVIFSLIVVPLWRSIGILQWDRLVLNFHGADAEKKMENHVVILRLINLFLRRMTGRCHDCQSKDLIEYSESRIIQGREARKNAFNLGFYYWMHFAESK